MDNTQNFEIENPVLDELLAIAMSWTIEDPRLLEPVIEEPETETEDLSDVMECFE